MKNLENCKNWLKEYLIKNGSTECSFVKEEAKEAGFTKQEIKLARKELGVKTWHQFDEDGATPNWFWHL